MKRRKWRISKKRGPRLITILRRAEDFFKEHPDEDAYYPPEVPGVKITRAANPGAHDNGN